MYNIEREIFKKCDRLFYWKRYIDDCFVIFDTSLPAEELLRLVNSINPHIKFTYELPDGNKLPFLDTLVQRTDAEWNFQLYFKPSHSGACLPFDSAVPISRKRNLISNELLRARRNSSVQNIKKSEEMVIHRLQQVGYTTDFIQATGKMYQKKRNENKQQPVTYIRIPFVSDEQRKKILSLRRSTSTQEKIRIIFQTKKPLGQSLRPKKECLVCPPNYRSCSFAAYSNTCNKTFSVYKIMKFVFSQN